MSDQVIRVKGAWGFFSRFRRAQGQGLLKMCCKSVTISGLAVCRVRHVEPIRDCAIGRDEVRDGVGQNQLRQIEMSISEKRIALIDEIEDRAYDQGNHERTRWHAIRYAASVYFH